MRSITNEDLLFLERLGHIVDAARSEGLDLLVDSLEAAHEDNRDISQSLVPV
jgi:hypothetical protein